VGKRAREKLDILSYTNLLKINVEIGEGAPVWRKTVNMADN